MRERERILHSLESVYRAAFDEAEKRDDRERMDRLDFDFQRDQLYLEAILDVRELLLPAPEEEESKGGVRSILDKAQAIRSMTRLR